MIKAEREARALARRFNRNLGGRLQFRRTKHAGGGIFLVGRYRTDSPSVQMFGHDDERGWAFLLSELIEIDRRGW